jgi:hypothetical protein
MPEPNGQEYGDYWPCEFMGPTAYFPMGPTPLCGGRFPPYTQVSLV